jgi:hypothetical protein
MCFFGHITISLFNEIPKHQGEFMKKINFKLLMVIAALPFSFSQFVSAAETEIPVDHIYAPAGFDSNDNTEVVITGYLPNLCYKAPKSTVTVKNGKIAVTMNAIRRNNGMALCTVIKLPYSETVDIGVLDKGKYQVAVNEKTSFEFLGKLTVAEATSNSIDDVIYANVEKVERLDAGKRTVLLTGYNPSDCFELKEIVVKDNGTDTFSILPKMKQVREFCPKKMIPFTYEFEVPETLTADKVLLHVRVMDGRAVNAFFENKLQLE